MSRKKTIDADVKMIEKLKTRTPDTIYDDDSGELVAVTDDMREEFWDRYEALKSHLFEASKQLYTIKEKRLYLAAGFNSFKAFYESAGISKRNALRQLKVGEKIKLLSDAGANNNEKVPTLAPSVHQNVHQDDEKVPTWAPSVHQNVHQIENIGYRKFYEITRLSQEQFAALMAGEEVGGYTLPDFEKMTARELAHTISQVKKGNDKDSIARLKEKAAKLKSENEVLKQRQEEAEKAIREARELQAKYGPLDNSVKGKLLVLKSAREHMDSFLKLMARIEITPDDTPAVIGAVQGIISVFRTYWGDDQRPGLEAQLMEVLGDE